MLPATYLDSVKLTFYYVTASVFLRYIELTYFYT